VRQTGWELKHDGTSRAVAKYEYLGASGEVIDVQLPQVAMTANRFGASASTFPDLDHFDRHIQGRPLTPEDRRQRHVGLAILSGACSTYPQATARCRPPHFRSFFSTLSPAPRGRGLQTAIKHPSKTRLRIQTAQTDAQPGFCSNLSPE